MAYLPKSLETIHRRNIWRKRLVKVIMRDKSNNGNLSYFFDDGSQVTELRKNSLFMQGFLKIYTFVNLVIIVILKVLAVAVILL